MRQIRSTDTVPAKSELDFEIIEVIKPQILFTGVYSTLSIYYIECGSAGLQLKQELAAFFVCLFDSATDMLCDLEVQIPTCEMGIIILTYFEAKQMKSLRVLFKSLQLIINAVYISSFFLFRNWK